MLTESQFVELYTTHRAKIRQLCYRFSSTEAHDWTEEIFLRVWQKRDTFRGACKPSTWLHRIAVNHCLYRVRRVKNRVFVPVEDDMFETRPSQYSSLLALELLSMMRESEARAVIRFIIGDYINSPKERSLRRRGKLRAING